MPSQAAVPVTTAEAEATIGQLGARPGATRLPLPVSDQVSASLDVGTGNLMVSISAASLPRVNGDAGLGVVYNSLSKESGATHVHPRWNPALGSAGALSTAVGGVLFTSGDGYSALSTPVPGSPTAFTPPSGVKADLVKTSTGYTLTSRTTAEVQTFDADGKAVSVADRNGNKTTLRMSRWIGFRSPTTPWTAQGESPTSSTPHDAAGRTKKRVDASGTTSYQYNQLGRLITREHNAGGGIITYGYDNASNLVSTRDSRGTTTYEFDAAGTPTALKLRHQGQQKTLAFATDDRGRRTDSWLGANAARTTWDARTHTDYDTSGRVVRTTAYTGPNNTNNTLVMDLSYCYTSGTTAPNCTANPAADRSKIQWVKDNVTGAVTASPTPTTAQDA